MTVQQIGQCLARDAKSFGRCGHGKAERLEALLSDNFAGMRRLRKRDRCNVAGPKTRFAQIAPAMAE
jgi:hypothetical protein